MPKFGNGNGNVHKTKDQLYQDKSRYFHLNIILFKLKVPQVLKSTELFVRETYRPI
jgi:hypothetical protein